MTLEKFATDFINSLQSNKANSFKEKYRKYDLLIIDDIQFIGKMEKIQEELFHTFNTFHENNKQIIFSSDKHPNYIPELADRLKSRFAAGMIVDISEPEYESRLAILKVKLRELNINLEEDLMEYIAGSVQGNIRELERAVERAVAVCAEDCVGAADLALEFSPAETGAAVHDPARRKFAIAASTRRTAMPIVALNKNFSAPLRL